MILDEFSRRVVACTRTEIIDIGKWAKKKMKLPVPPSRYTVKRIINESESIIERSESISKHQKRISKVTSVAMEECISDWVYDMMEQNVSINDGLIQEKAQEIQEYMNSTLPIHKHFTLQFSNGWLASFKSRNEFNVIVLMVKPPM